MSNAEDLIDIGERLVFFISYLDVRLAERDVQLAPDLLGSGPWKGRNYYTMNAMLIVQFTTAN